MSVANSLGVDDLDAPHMRELRAEWPRWRQMSSDLPDVDDLKDLPRWMQDDEPTQRDEVLTALRRVAEGDRRAYVALAWLLMPGAARVAGRISRLADEIDEIVARQLWFGSANTTLRTTGTWPRRSWIGFTGSRWPSSAMVILPSTVTRRGR